MNEIICPHCGKAFKVDEAGYADILKQVRDSEFEQQLHDRLELAEKDKLSAVELAKNEVGSEMQKATAAKDAEIQGLKANLDAGEVARKLAVAEALSAVEKKRDALANELEQTKRDHLAASRLAEAKLGANEVEQKLAITEAVSAVEKERDELKNGLKQAELEKQLAEKSLKDKYETQIKDRDDAIERLRDMKARLSRWLKPSNSTAKLNSTADQRSVSTAYFEKDNDASTGSKGDYIFRDSDKAGTEIVSIMFEMKNESDTTATKKKNEDFLKNSTRIVLRRGASTQCWCPYSNPTVSSTILGLSTYFIVTRRCTSFGRSSLFQSLLCSVTRP